MVERKDGDSDIRNAVRQLNSTLGQLRNQGKHVSQLIVVFNKFSKTESKLYKRHPQNKALISLASTAQKQVSIENIPLEMYTSNEVTEMRKQRILL